MARPIKETPILKGTNAKNFIEKTKNTKPLNKETQKRIKENYEKLNSITNI